MLGSSFFSGLTIFCICSCPAQTFTVTYGFPNVSPTSGSVDPGPSPTVTALSLGTFTAVGLSANPSASGRFSFTGWPVGALDGADNYATYTAALSPFSYYEVALTVQPGYTLDLQSVSFDVRRSGTGVRNYCVRSNIDSYTNNLSATTGTNSKLEVIPNDVFFWKYDSISTSNDQKGSSLTPGALYSNITQPLQLRFYAWNSESNGGSFSIDNVKLSGRMIDSVMLLPINERNIENNTLFTFYHESDVPEIIQVNYSVECRKIELRDLGGRLLLKFVPDPVGDQRLKITNLPPGIYFLTAFTKEKHITKKIIVPFY